jgi:hypothetical protein
VSEAMGEMKKHNTIDEVYRPSLVMYDTRVAGFRFPLLPSIYASHRPLNAGGEDHIRWRRLVAVYRSVVSAIKIGASSIRGGLSRGWTRE